MVIHVRGFVLALVVSMLFSGPAAGQTPPAVAEKPLDPVQLSQLKEDLALQEALAAREAESVRRIQEALESQPRSEELFAKYKEREARLHKLLDEAFDIKQKIEQDEIRGLKERIGQLERNLEQREAQRMKIVDRRAQALIAGLQIDSSRRYGSPWEALPSRATTVLPPSSADSAFRNPLSLSSATPAVAAAAPLASTKPVTTTLPPAADLVVLPSEQTASRPVTVASVPAGALPSRRTVESKSPPNTYPLGTAIAEPDREGKAIEDLLKGTIVQFEMTVPPQQPDDDEVIYLNGVRVSAGGLVAIPATQKLLSVGSSCRVLAPNVGSALLVKVDEAHCVALLQLDAAALGSSAGEVKWLPCSKKLPAKGQRLLTNFHQDLGRRSTNTNQVAVSAVGIKYKSPGTGNDAFTVSRATDARENVAGMANAFAGNMMGGAMGSPKSLIAGTPLMTMDGYLQGIHLGEPGEMKPGETVAYACNVPAVHIQKMIDEVRDAEANAVPNETKPLSREELPGGKPATKP